MSASRAALPAAIGAGLYALWQLVNGVVFAGLASGDTALVLAATALPNAAWCGFFVMLHRGRMRFAAVFALALAIAPRTVYVTAALAGGAWSSAAVPALLTLFWAMFLVALLRGGKRWLAPLALFLLLLTALSCLDDIVTILSSVNELLSGSLALFFRYNPMRTLWRQGVTPVILIVYWLTQIRFLLAVRNDG